MGRLGETSANDAKAVVGQHVRAFNAHDSEAVFATLDPQVEWTTGKDTFHGHAELNEVFDPGLWTLNPSVRVLNLLGEGNRAALEFEEELTVGGQLRRFTIAAFFHVTDGKITKVKVYREGTADI